LRYLIALGSNRPHGRFGRPERVIQAAIAALGGQLLAVSRTHHSRPIGPSQRAYANAAGLIDSDLPPPALLARLKAIERAFGRRAGGRRWGARVLDLDIILWSGGIWAGPGLGIPHRAFRTRRFVLDPLCEIAGDWRDPLTGLAVRHLKARLDRKRRAA
jgi:2-amino-4-hydroxy-6-hydroxymethyldihydropteridine diphosphokinase